MLTVSAIKSERTVPLPTHHFRFAASMNIQVRKGPTPEKRTWLQTSALDNQDIAACFVSNFAECSEIYDGDDADTPSLMYARMVDSFTNAAEAVLPRRVWQPNKPWINSRTTDLIADRHAVRAAGKFLEERRLAKLVKFYAAADQSDLLNDLVKRRDGDVIRRLSKGFVKQQGRSRNACGKLVGLEERSDTLLAGASEAPH